MRNTTFNVASTAAGSQSLQSVLLDILQNYNTSDDCVTVQLTDPGRYELTRRFTFSCNFSLRGYVGKEGNKSEIFFKKASFPDNKVETWGDGFISVEGEISHLPSATKKNRVAADISNLILRLEDKTFIGNINQSALLLLKFWGCYRVKITNVDTYLANGPITNIDIRESDNITVKNCIIENRNAKYGAEHGGNLWIRGGCRNVLVASNKFYKNGNDELFAIWGGDGNREYNMEDIRIADNEFTYGSPDESAHAMDVLLNFESSYENLGKNAQNWKNITFANNIITCNSAVKRVLWITVGKECIVENFKISGNLFHHTDFKDTTIGTAVEDIEIRNQQSSNVSAFHDIFHITGNTFVARETITNNNRHRLLILNNADAEFSGNYIDSIGQKTITSSKTYNGLIVISTIGDVCNVLAHSNTAKGIDVLYYSLGSASAPAKEINCTFMDNSLQDGSQLYLRQIEKANIIFKGNIIRNAPYFSLFQEMAKTGNIHVSDNVFIRNENITSAVIYERYDQSYTPRLNLVTITGNTFAGYDSNVINGLSAASTKSITGNNTVSQF